jgi:hypothetical protein
MPSFGPKPHGKTLDRQDRRFCGAFHALAINDGGGHAPFAFAMLPALPIQHVKDANERAVVASQIERIDKR